MAAVTFSDAQGLAKRVYEEVVHDIRPEAFIIAERCKFEKGNRVGESYRISIGLVPPNGYTYVGKASTQTQSTTLLAGRPSVVQQAEVVPFEIDLQEDVLMAVFSQIAEQGEAAVASYLSEMLGGMMMSARNRTEASMLLGQYPSGVGVVDTGGVTDLGSNLATIQFTQGSWRPGFWWAMGQGATFDAFTSTTKNNATGALILKSVDAENRKITVQYSGTVANEVQAADVIFPEGAWNGTTFFEAPGLFVQGSNTSGTSLGISAAASSGYMNWQGNTSTLNGVMTLDILETILSKLRDRGANKKLTAFLANINYSAVLAEVRAQRVIDSSYSPSKVEAGTASVEFNSPKVGKVELVGHPMLAWGELYVQNDRMVSRIGSQDFGPRVEGAGAEGNLELIKTAGTNKFTSMLFSNQAPVNKRPNHTYFGTGLTVS